MIKMEPTKSLSVEVHFAKCWFHCAHEPKRWPHIGWRYHPFISSSPIAKVSRIWFYAFGWAIHIDWTRKKIIPILYLRSK